MPKPATCHPDQPVVARGLCRRCYTAEWKAARDGVRQRRTYETARSSLSRSWKTAVRDLPALTPLPVTLTAALTETEHELIAALPEAARALRRTLECDPKTGYPLKAAALLLKHFPVSEHGEPARRILAAPAKADSPMAGTQIIIGVKMGSDEPTGQVVTQIDDDPSRDHTKH